MDNVTAMVLAGGRNEGFGVLTGNRAKAALPFAGHFRLVDFALSSLSESGLQRVGLIIQFLPGSLLDHVGTGQAWDYDGIQRRLKIMPPFVGVRDTEWYQGSADALRKNIRFHRIEEGSDVVVCSGEHAHAIDFSEIIAFHRARDSDLTIVTKRVRPEEDSPRFGRVEFHPESMRVTRFAEKPAENFSSWISTGVYVFRGQSLERALMNGPEGDLPCNLPSDVVEPLSREGRAYACAYSGPWHYIEDLGAYYQAHRRLLSGDPELMDPLQDTRTNMLDRGLASRPPAYCGPQAEVRSSILSPGSRVYGRVVDSILSPGVYVAPGAEVRDSIILHDVRVERGAALRRVVVDKDAWFEEGARVGLVEGGDGRNPELPASAQTLAVVGKGARIGSGASIPLGVQVYPGVVVGRDNPSLAEGLVNIRSGAMAVASR